MNSGTAVLAASLIALAAASMPGKLALDAGGAGAPDLTAPDLTPPERAAVAALEAGQWLAAGQVPLTDDGVYRVHMFYGPMCDDVIFLTEVSANAEIHDLLTELGGTEGRLFFLQGGLLHTEVSALRAYLQDKLGPLLTRVGLSGATGHHRMVAIVATGLCREAVHLPWPSAQ
jgi:hypothetical protein